MIYHPVAYFQLLLSKYPKTEITEAAVVEISRRSDQDIMQMLLAKNPNTKITEAVVIAAASNKWSGEKVMRVLLTKNPNIEITEAVVTAAAENKWVRREMTQSSGKEIMKVLLARDVNIEITEAAVVKIAREFDKDIIKLLLAKNSTKMTKAVITAMAMNGWNSDEITKLRQIGEGF